MAYSFGATGLLGSHSGWSLQSSTVNKNKAVARVLGATGTEAAINATNETEEVTESFKCDNNTNTVPATIGADIGTSYVLTGIDLTLTADDYATMNLTAHKHNDGTPPAVTGLKQVAHNITVSQAFGIAVSVGVPAGLTGAGTGNTAADVTSISIRISCEHAEAIGADGTVVAHENYDGKIEITIEAQSAITAPTGYTTTSQTAPQEGNTEFDKYTWTGQKKLTLA